MSLHEGKGIGTDKTGSMLPEAEMTDSESERESSDESASVEASSDGVPTSPRSEASGMDPPMQTGWLQRRFRSQ